MNFLPLIAAKRLEICYRNPILSFRKDKKALAFPAQEAVERLLRKQIHLLQSNMENNNTDTDYLGYMVLLKSGEGT